MPFRYSFSLEKYLYNAISSYFDAFNGCDVITKYWQKLIWQELNLTTPVIVNPQTAKFSGSTVLQGRVHHTTVFCSFNVVGITVAWVLNSSRCSVDWKVRRLYVIVRTVHGRANGHCKCNLYLLSYLSLLSVISIFHSSLYFLPPPPQKKIVLSLGKLLLIPSKPVMEAGIDVVFCWTQPAAVDRQYTRQKLTSIVSATHILVEKRLVVIPSVMINFELNVYRHKVGWMLYTVRTSST